MQDSSRLFKAAYIYSKEILASGFELEEKEFNERVERSLEYVGTILKNATDKDTLAKIISSARTTLAMEYKNHHGLMTKVAQEALGDIQANPSVPAPETPQPTTTDKSAVNSKLAENTIRAIDWNNLQVKKLTLQKEFADIKQTGGTNEPKIANYFKIFKDYKTLYDSYKIALEMAGEVSPEQKSQVASSLQKLDGFAVPELDPAVFKR